MPVQHIPKFEKQIMSSSRQLCKHLFCVFLLMGTVAMLYVYYSDMINNALNHDIARPESTVVVVDTSVRHVLMNSLPFTTPTTATSS